MPSTNILSSVDHHAWVNVYHLLKTIYPYHTKRNICKIYLDYFLFELIKTILLNSLKTHLAQYEHLRSPGALGWLSLSIFHWIPVCT